MNAFLTPPPPDDRRNLRLEQGRRRWTKKKVAGWIAATILTVVALIVVALAILWNSPSFHQYALAKAEQTASEALGAPIQVQNFALHLSTLSVDLYGVNVQGAAPYSSPPLLQVDHIGMGVRIVSLLHRTWYLDNLTIEHPVVQVFVDQSGRDNLPQTKPKPRPKNNQSSTSIFDLAIRHALLNRGEVYYNNRKSVLDADLHDLTFQSAFDNTQRMYSGILAYRNGHLQMSNFKPMEHDLEAQFEATPTAFTLKRAVLNSGTSTIALTATAEDYSNPRMQAHYDATINAGEFRQILKNPTLPIGIIRASGSMQYQGKANRAMLDVLTTDGNISSRALQIKTPSFHGEIANVGAHYALANGNLDVRDMRARLLGGELTGSMLMRNITGASQSQLHAALRGISLADLRTMMPSASLKQVALGGTVSAIADAKWGKTFNNIVAHTDATLQASIGPSAASANTKPMPLQGTIHATYSAATKQIALANSFLRTPQTSINVQGTVSDRSSMQVQLQSNDLHEIESLSATFVTPPKQLGLYGTASFSGAVRGSTSAPQITGQLSAANLKLRDSAFRSLRTNIALSPSLASLQNGELVLANRGRATFNVSTGLQNWSFTNTSPINVALNASSIDIAELQRAAGQQFPATGTLSANISVHGSELNPIGQGQVNLTDAKVSNEPIQSLKLTFQGTGNEIHSNLTLQMPAGAAQALVTYFPKEQGYDAQLQASGIQLNKLQTLKARKLQLVGVLNINASGRGTLNNPQLTATVQVPKLQTQDQTISGITLQANVANHLANVALDSQAVNTSIRARGSVRLDGDYYANATLDTQTIPLQPLIATYAPSQAANVTGSTELHGTLRGPLKNKSQIDAHLTIPTLRLNYKNTVQLGAANPIQIDYNKGAIELKRAVIRGTATDLQLQASIPTDKSQPASLLALGTVDLHVLQLLDPDIASSGQMRFNINSYGATTDPNVQGQIEIVNATLATADVPLGFENGNGVLLLTKDRLNIKQFHGTVGGGTVTAQGGIVYKPSLHFDLALAGNGIRMLYPDNVREALDLNLTLTGSTESAQLNGRVQVGQLSFTPDFDLAEFVGQLSGETTAAPSQGFSQNVELNLSVQSTTGVNLVSRTMSAQGSANLQVRGTAAQPVILGRINLSGGDFIFRGNRYVLQSGTLDFVNPVQTQPVVNVGMSTTVQQYNINLRFQGPVDHLQTNYSSDPALPPSDIINLLAFGQTTEASAANSTQPGNLGAQSLIASGVSNQVTSRVEKIAGISYLSVDPVLGAAAGQQNPGARITVQQRVTSNVFVTFATDVTSTQRETIQVQYRLSPRVSVSGTRDQNGGFGFDTRIKKSW